jgi:type IV pilus assembly protein PilO
MFEALGKLPVWQRILVWIIGAGLILGLWYFLFWEDAVAGRVAAEQGVVKARAELEAVEGSQAAHETRKKEVAAAEQTLAGQREVLPLNASTVDNLMQTFQQQSRLVGMSVESWTNEPEEFEDFYARMPIRVRASGTWSQVGEFFRRVSELKRIVSVDKLSLKLRNTPTVEVGAPPVLDVEFEAATYRFMTDAERTEAATKPARRKEKRKK